MISKIRITAYALFFAAIQPNIINLISNLFNANFEFVTSGIFKLATALFPLAFVCSTIIYVLLI
jgi:hypothetical protein